MPIELYPGKHLFVDDYRIEELRYARRVLQQPQKHPGNPVFRPETAWEVNGVNVAQFLYDRERQKFRMWYTATASTVIGTRVLVKDNPPTEVHESHICYAESADGVKWVRPATDITEPDRYPGNNIIVVSKRPPGRTNIRQVIDDPFETEPRKRFKMFYLDQGGEGEVGDGLAPDAKLRLHAHSPDGIHWTNLPWEPDHVARLFGVLAYLEETPSGPMNPDARFILYGQRGSPWKTRQIGRRDSNDFIHWSNNRPVLESRLSDTPPGLEFYSMQSAIVNRTYAGLHLGILGAYQTDLRRKYDPARNDGLTGCQLTYSRDTMRWERWTTPFLERGGPGSFDYGGVYCHYPSITEDGIYFLYTGESGRHGKASTPTTGLATMRLDGFVAVEPEGYMKGVVITRPHLWKSTHVRLNVDSPEGVRVQLQDETGRSFEGFREDDCEPIAEDALDKVVTWGKKGSDVRALQGKMVALKITLAPEGKLYSYTLTPEG